MRDVIQGAELEALFRSVANAQPHDRRFEDLAQNRDFKLLSRRIPGMETD